MSEFEDSSLSLSEFYCPSIKKNTDDIPRFKKHLDNRQSGRWNQQQQSLYLQFILQNKHTLEIKQFRRSSKIFKFMAIHLKTRAADQCRSHHQKMQKKFHSLTNIIQNCKQSLNFLKMRHSENNKSQSQIRKLHSELIKFGKTETQVLLICQNSEVVNQNNIKIKDDQTVLQESYMEGKDLLEIYQEDPYRIIFLGHDYCL